MDSHQALIEVAIIDWPERFPDFMPQLLSDLSDPSSKHFALETLKLLAEEIVPAESRQRMRPSAARAHAISAIMYVSRGDSPRPP